MSPLDSLSHRNSHKDSINLIYSLWFETTERWVEPLIIGFSGGISFWWTYRESGYSFWIFSFKICDIKGWLKPNSLIWHGFLQWGWRTSNLLLFALSGERMSVCSARQWFMNFSESPGNYIGPHTRFLWTPYHPCALSKMEKHSEQKGTEKDKELWQSMVPTPTTFSVFISLLFKVNEAWQIQKPSAPLSYMKSTFLFFSRSI